MASIEAAMPSGTTAGKPQVLLGHHLKQLKLPTILREYDKVARECAREWRRSSQIPSAPDRTGTDRS